MECLPCIFHKIDNNNIQQMHFSMFIYIYKHSCMFRPVWAIFREYDLVLKQHAVNIKQYLVEVVS